MKFEEDSDDRSLSRSLVGFPLILVDDVRVKRGQYSSLDLHAMIDVVPMKYENDDDDVDDDYDVQYQK